MTQYENLHAAAAFTLIAFIGSCLATGWGWGATDDPLETARKLIRDGAFEEAAGVLAEYIERIRDVASQQQRVAEAHYLLAKMYYEVGDDPRFVENMRAALQYDPMIGRDEPNADVRERLDRIQAEGVPPLKAKEREGAPGRCQAKRKFPWLIAAGVAVAAVIVVLLLTRDRNRTLTVEVGEGVAGTPRAGSYSYRKGTRIEYQFELTGAYKDLAVRIDGVAAPASGTLLLSRDIRLEASATSMAAVVTLVVRGPDHCRQLVQSPARFTSVLPGSYSLKQVSGTAYASLAIPFRSLLACYTDSRHRAHVAAIAIPQFSPLMIGHSTDVTHLYTFFVDDGSTADNSGEITLDFGSLQVRTHGKDNCFRLSDLSTARISIPAGVYRLRFSSSLYWVSELVEEVLIGYPDGAGSMVFGSVDLFSAKVVATAGGVFHAFLARDHSQASYFSGEARLEFLQ